MIHLIMMVCNGTCCISKACLYHQTRIKCIPNSTFSQPYPKMPTATRTPPNRKQVRENKVNFINYTLLKYLICALAGMAQWTECRPANQKVTSSIPTHGTCLGCRPGPQMGACKRQPHIAAFSPLSPSIPLSLKVNKKL